MKIKKIDFSTKAIAKMGIFSALSFVLTYLEFPIFVAVPFLKLDFSNLFVLIGGFSLGTIPGVIILIVKEALCLLKSTTVVGQLANLILGLSYVLLPFIVYEYKKSFKRAIYGLSLGCLLTSFISLLVNRYINFPLYGASDSMFLSVWGYILAFNAIKSIAITVVTLLLYKRVKSIINF